MINRREMLKWGAVAPAVAGMPAMVKAATPQGVDMLVVDRRFLPTPADLPAVAAPVQWIDGDVTRLWYEQLDLRWRRPGFVVGGITGPDALWVLEVLARDRGRRVISRKVLPAGERAALGAIAPVSWIIAPVHPSVKG